MWTVNNNESLAYIPAKRKVKNYSLVVKKQKKSKNQKVHSERKLKVLGKWGEGQDISPFGILSIIPKD